MLHHVAQQSASPHHSANNNLLSPRYGSLISKTGATLRAYPFAAKLRARFCNVQAKSTKLPIIDAERDLVTRNVPGRLLAGLRLFHLSPLKLQVTV
eukprot:scaffold125986_cov16-Prasinocladus_malaysianus.AAC.1